MNTALWIVQILLGAMMILLGLMKTFLPVEQLSRLSWTTRNSKAFVRFVGISELLIGLGLILPQLTGIKPALTSWAAISLCIVMAAATMEHIRYHERNEIWKNVLISMLGLFVAVGRLVPLHL
jgi:putative oxidoreductase